MKHHDAQLFRPSPRGITTVVAATVDIQLFRPSPRGITTVVAATVDANAPVATQAQLLVVPVERALGRHVHIQPNHDHAPAEC